MHKRRQIVTALPLFSILLGASRIAFGQPCCERGPTRIVVAEGAGGLLDIVARYIASKLTDLSKQPVVIDNRGGASGIIAAGLVAKTAPDGYTLLIAYNALFVQIPFLIGKPPLDPLNDLVPVAQVAVVPYALALNTSIPASTVKEFASLARAQPNKFEFSSAGSGTSSHLAALSFNSVAQINATHVPYKGSAPAIADVVSGNVAYTFVGAALAKELARSGKVKILGITGDRRSSLIPDTPTLKEIGLQVVDASRWIGVFAPSGVPADEVTRISNTITSIMRLPEAKNRLSSIGLEVDPIDATRLAAKIREESTSWAKVIKQAGIKTQ